MKEFLIGLVCGVVLSASAVYAKDTMKFVQASVSSTTVMINDEYKKMDSNYEVLSYKDHLYVPVRFITENTSMSVQYDGKKNAISLFEAPFYPNATFKDIVKGEAEKIVFDVYGGPEVITDKKLVADHLKRWEEFKYTRVKEPDYAHMRREDLRILIGGSTIHLYDKNNNEIANMHLVEEELMRINNNYYRLDKSALN
ncbi:stalk domain-containing protein [Aneurinibacillus uraniidurans]|uniref:stalk domain-containing protein n=1 Tax=Aneurinibacillus uraniidurans TaxID=2966586 RepID=UPI00234B609A|nr:stalk domain-containing protein [Aneurinibacillus sp. B1]WCN39356.1 stalk domain-containing protein [Aneurinibacillus sp. B1]